MRAPADCQYLTACQISRRHFPASARWSLCRYQESSKRPSHRSQATDLIAGLTCGIVDPIDHIVQQTAAIRLLLHTVSSWQPAAGRTSPSPATETAGKLSLMSEGGLPDLSGLLQSLKGFDYFFAGRSGDSSVLDIVAIPGSGCLVEQRLLQVGMS